ncbi:GSU3473 family protein [Geobacter argillaceus]|uniref:Uncharacterized protein n=1 Tax=Geobacter argillaceus TaxID=345631 RepID=A0A562WRU8_9BACT|nr:hypothetical protein [Geobacter argillaceus]TWJ33129.1 hypothetical protein JN12_00542 [Geobacter argillaceus]
MMVRIIYHDNRYDMVKSTRLDDLISSKAVAKFERSSGWVTIGVDPIRTPKSRQQYTGQERRSSGSTT